MSKKEKRIIITSNAINAYGTRVLTEGLDIEQYMRNPVLLYMHNRGEVIGYLSDIQREEDKISGIPCFDEASEISRRVKRQWVFGSIKMSSVGIDILEMSHAKELLVEGQTRPTITKSKLIEVSMVDIGANDEALALYKDGKLLTLSSGGESDLPLLTNQNDNQQTERTMDEKKLALMLGLPETATSEEIEAALSRIKDAKEELEQIKKQNEQMVLSAITAAVDGAIAQKRLAADKKEQFVNLGKQVGLDELNKVLEAMTPGVKMSSMLNKPSGGGSAPAAYTKLSEVPVSELVSLRSENRELYKKLYEAEYGIPCVIFD